MNPLLLKGIGLVKKVLSSDLAKPLPGSGIIERVEDVFSKKIEAKKVIKLAKYLISASIIWGVILGKIDMTTASKLAALFGF